MVAISTGTMARTAGLLLAALALTTAGMGTPAVPARPARRATSRPGKR